MDGFLNKTTAPVIWLGPFLVQILYVFRNSGVILVTNPFEIRTVT